MKQETLEQIVSKQFQKEFNKEVGKVLVQELKKKEMKQTAVEWLVDEMIQRKFFEKETELSYTTLEHLTNQAKEMEKQQQGYSEEEVIDIAKQAFVLGKDFGLIGTFNEWFEQFKKK